MGADVCYYNSNKGPFMSEGEAEHVVQSRPHRIPDGHPRGWDYMDVSESFVGSNENLRLLRVKSAGSNDEARVEEEDG